MPQKSLLCQKPHFAQIPAVAPMTMRRALPSLMTVLSFSPAPTIRGLAFNRFPRKIPDVSRLQRTERWCSYRMALPSAAEIKSATFMQCVSHAENVLVSAGATPSSEHFSLIDALLTTGNGSRGLFVTLLADPRVALADTPLPDQIVSLIAQNKSGTVLDLLAKNLVMSSCMVLHYTRSGEDDNRTGSMLTKERSMKVVAQCLAKDDELKRVLEEMVAALEGDDETRFSAFVKKWGYDAEQKHITAKALREVLGQP